MQKIQCPTCGRETDPEAACPGCGHAANNSASNGVRHESAPEGVSWAVESVPPEVREHFLRTFNESEYWAALREAEKAADDGIDDLLVELERKLHGQS